MSGALIAAGYATLIWAAGWWGVLAVCAHVAMMLSAIKRR